MKNNTLNHITYICTLCLLLLIFFMVLIIWASQGKDHPAAIPLHGDPSFYRSFTNRLMQEIQDRDIFYHNIGKSIHYAKQADIVILGHSMVLFALQEDLMKSFENKHGIKFYNLGSAGDGSGEFLRRIIKRWKIKPKMWIINADDFGRNFFYIYLDDFGFGQSSAINVVKYNRLIAYKHVLGRNFRWRIEDFLLTHFPSKFTNSLFKDSAGVTIWRNIEDGHWYLDNYPSYLKQDNPIITLTRSQDCHTTQEEIQQAKRYLAEIGEKPTLFTLVPYHGFCPQRVKELAKALKIEYLIPPNVNYSALDSGGHLDKKGSIAFTKFFLAKLEKSKTFKNIAPR